MSQDRLTALRLLSYYWLTIIMPPNILAYNVVYNREPSSTSFQSSAFYQGSSRKFGGYRIVPKACKDETAAGGGGTSYRDDAPATGVCMFNYECTQLGGAVVGSCVDVFLFGACCRLPAGVKVPAVVEHGGVTTTTVATTADGPPRDTLTPVSFQQPVADTILYHRNGSVVQNTYRPDDMSADLLANFTALLQQHQQQRPPAAGDYLTDNAAVVHVHYQQQQHQQQLQQQGGYDRRPPFSSGTNNNNNNNNNKFASKVDYGGGGGGSSFAKPTPPRLSSSSPSSPVSKSTDSVPNVRKTTPSSSSVQATTSKLGYGGGGANPDEYYDNMVLIPTLTVHDPNVKAPPAVENNSINHILSILNQTPATSGGGGGGASGSDPMESDSMDSSSSASYAYAHPSSTHPPSSSSSSPALYTWGSIETADSKSPGYGSSSTFPATRPTSYYTQQQQQQQHYYGSTPSTTSTHHLPGPHFHVSTTTRPVDPVVPTVIVLSPANDSKHPPNKYSTSTGSATTSSSSSTTAASYSAHRPSPSSHVKPSQSIIVTGKPSVSAAYTTTATYLHSQQQQQQQQDIAFVPVSSTTLADKYYNSNNNNNNNYHQAALHTSAKPLISSAKPSHTTYSSHRPSTTTSLPPTLSSTVHNDNNNNVFTTVITSVNHQYHGGNKYQSTTTSSPPAATYSTTARPVVNDAGTAAVVQPTTSYRPPPPQQHHHHYPTDDDYPSVTPPASQVFITASEAAAAQYIHQHQQQLLQQQQQQQHGHYPLQQHTSSSAYPVAPAADDYGTPHPFNITDTFAFPPVRDPYVNLTAASQQERPPDVTVVDGGDYDADADPNPQLTADENLDDKVHLFVEKVVQSLQGNFEDLERVLLSGDAAANVSVGYDDAAASASTTSWPPNKKKPVATTTKKPATSSSTASKPGNKPTKPAKPATSTYRPTPITPPTYAPYLELQTTARPPPPTKVPTLLTPVQLFQPTGATYGSTQDNKRPTKQPTRVPVSTTTVVLDTLNVEHDHTTPEPDYRKTCGVRPLVRKNGRIVGGTGSTFGEWPWQVLVREATWLGLFTKNKCGGVLITQRHVITAAHCQPGFLANLVAVFGEYDISGEVESKRSISKNVKRVIVHRQYDAATFENDIALLELESPVAYDTHIVPICMPDDEDDFTGRMAVVTGWGRLKYGGGVPSILQEVQVPIIENQVCQDMFETAGHTKTILSSFLCAGYANGQRDSCEGDSGGPLMIEKDNGRWTLIGTVSHGIKCAAPYLPGVYMRTTYYKPWLQTITGVQ